MPAHLDSGSSIIERVDIATSLRRARRRAGLTQRALASTTGVAQPTIARIERGHESPRVATLERLLRACGERLEAVPRGGIGVDRTLIRDLLARTPEERLRLAASDARGLAAFDAAVRSGLRSP